MEESASIAAALGIELPVSIDHRLERGIAVGDHKTSMLQDVEAGKPLEIDCLTEAVIELADQLDIPVPHTRTLHACVTLLGTRACATPKPAPLIAAAPLPAVA
jgi:2-dehydropantoate 2-reductase